MSQDRNPEKTKCISGSGVFVSQLSRVPYYLASSLNTWVVMLGNRIERAHARAHTYNTAPHRTALTLLA